MPLFFQTHKPIYFTKPSFNFVTYQQHLKVSRDLKCMIAVLNRVLDINYTIQKL